MDHRADRSTLSGDACPFANWIWEILAEEISNQF
jgi:hypothetical protein